MVSPCVDVLRKLATKINGELGSRQGARHTVPDIQKDIATLMKVLKEHRVYDIIEGRTVDHRDNAVPDVISVGLAQLSQGKALNPINEFNQQFERLRERRKLTPISDDLDLTTVMLNDTTCKPNDLVVHTTDTARIEDQITGGQKDLQDSDTEGTTSSDSDTDDEVTSIHPDIDTWISNSPTLECINEEDVALDMDGWELDSDLEEAGSDEDNELDVD